MRDGTGGYVPTWQRKLAASLIAPLVAGPACGGVAMTPLFLLTIFMPLSIPVGYVWAIAPTLFFGLLGDSLVRKDRAWDSRRRWAAIGAILGFAVASVGELADRVSSFDLLTEVQLVGGFTAAGAAVAAVRHAMVYRMGPARRPRA